MDEVGYVVIMYFIRQGVLPPTVRVPDVAVLQTPTTKLFVAISYSRDTAKNDDAVNKVVLT